MVATKELRLDTAGRGLCNRESLGDCTAARGWLTSRSPHAAEGQARRDWTALAVGDGEPVVVGDDRSAVLDDVRPVAVGIPETHEVSLRQNQK
jgi:hypothetical protein